MTTNETIFLDYLKHQGATETEAKDTLTEIRTRIQWGAWPRDVMINMGIDVDLLDLL